MIESLRVAFLAVLNGTVQKYQALTYWGATQLGARSLLIIGGIATATLLYLIYLAFTFEAPEGTTTIVVQPAEVQPIQRNPEPVVVAETTQSIEIVPPPVAIPDPVPVEPEPEPEPTPESITEDELVDEPVVAEPEIEVVELPTLNNSDGFVLTQLRQLQSGAQLLGYLTNEQFIRRFVVLVDNISNGTLPQTNLPYKAVQVEMPIEEIDDNLFVMDESGFQRFDQAIDALVAIDADQAMGLYEIFSPLFQQAYGELGYRDRNFDNVLRQAIRKMLSTNEIDGPLQLIKPSVMFLYADSNIEGMEDIQKQMIRIGPDNAEKLKTKLRQILQRL